MRIALVQMAVADGNVAANVARAEGFVREAAASRPDVILLPELWTTGYAHDAWPGAADGETAGVARTLAAWSDELGVTIGGSMITRRADGALANQFTLTAPGGGTPVTYDKCHRFGPMRESELLGAGAGRVHAEMGDAQVALSICYDLRFPSMYRASAHAGARVFLVVSAWPKPRCVPLRTLAMARAIENQSFLALCNRVGAGADGTEFCGGSCIVSPVGELLLDLGGEEGVGVAEVDLAHTATARGAFDVLREELVGID